jgi:hypothetical protein
MDLSGSISGVAKLSEHTGGYNNFREFGSSCCLLHVGFSPGLFLHPEDGGNVFLRDASSLSQDYGVS